MFISLYWLAACFFEGLLRPEGILWGQVAALDSDRLRARLLLATVRLIQFRFRCRKQASPVPQYTHKRPAPPSVQEIENDPF